MIITNIIGGLGNQMFQYACGKALSLRTKQSFHVATNEFDIYRSHNGFELHRAFHVDAPQAAEADLKLLLGWRAPPQLRRLFSRPIMRWAIGDNWCIEPHFQYWSGINDIRTSKYLHGYWQSERYFVDAEDQIRKDFTFCMPWDDADLVIRDRMRAQPSVSLHVRRGDYTLAKARDVLSLCDLDYYRNAIGAVRQRIPGVRIFAFSDDPDWVDANLGCEFGPMETVRHNSGAQGANDMRLMSQADHHIIANSTFSWWGAWLNPSAEKIVVAPQRWFLNGTYDCDLIPRSWIRV